MAEHIEREALMLAIEDSWRNNPHTDPRVRQAHNHEHQHFFVLASKQPTADVVPVVRCKDCKHYKTDSYYCQKTKQGYCELDDTVKQKQGYCSYGERRCSDESGTY
jgi:hypothetical protein